MEKSVEGLIDLFLTTNDLNRVVNMAATVLKNPLLVCDMSCHFLAHSDLRDVEDKSWNMGIKRGYWPYEWISAINDIGLNFGEKKNTVHILTNVSQYSTCRRRLGLLGIDKIPIGYYLVLEEKSPLDSIPEETYEMVSGVLSKCVCLERPLQSAGWGNDCENIILTLLQDGFQDKSHFIERVQKSGFSGSGHYRVFCVEIRNRYSGKGLIYDSGQDIRNNIGRCLPLSWQVYYQNHLVVVADFGSKLYQREGILDALERFLSFKNLQAGLSDCFENLYQLKQYFEQAFETHELAQLMGDERPIVLYDDYKLYSLFDRIKEEEAFVQFATTDVQILSDFDKKNGTEYLETVFQYLRNGCSVKKTAEAMFVHRNTVTYRIARVNELFGIGFDNPDRNAKNYISCLLNNYSLQRYKD